MDGWTEEESQQYAFLNSSTSSYWLVLSLTLLCAAHFRKEAELKCWGFNNHRKITILKKHRQKCLQLQQKYQYLMPWMYLSTKGKNAQLLVCHWENAGLQVHQRESDKDTPSRKLLPSQGGISPQHRSGGCRWCHPADLWSRRISWPRRSPASPRRRLDRDSGSRWLGPTQKTAIAVTRHSPVELPVRTKWKQILTYAVQFIADDLAVAFVVVPIGNCVLQWPEQCVEHLNVHKHTRKVKAHAVSSNRKNVSAVPETINLEDVQHLCPPPR